MSDDLLYKLALRLSDQAHEEQAKLLLESVPENLPAPVPLPDGGQLLGSLIEGLDAVRIVQDMPGAQKERQVEPYDNF